MVRQLRAEGGSCTKGKNPNCFLGRLAFRPNPLDDPQTVERLEEATRRINEILDSLEPPEEDPERNTLAFIAEPDEEEDVDLLALAWVAWRPDEDARTR